ncbi:hypothetical protein [Adhaeribacter aerolatus]|uniref:hypothetical protein n=1 Tax=Adhaeribacter aerolatus TaxID=670289 RepID=UPI0011BE5808|nr:hypothetical protein [Adhaeribacter aerolatus]
MPDLRRLYEKGAKDEATCERLARHLHNYKGQDPVVLGFRAGTQGMLAKFAWGPYAKIKHLRTSSQLFDEVIKKHPLVAEVRFLRYSLEFFIPRYLNMSHHLEEDKKIFLNSLFRYPNSDIEADVYQAIRHFLLKHPEGLTEQEKKLLYNLKA